MVEAINKIGMAVTEMSNYLIHHGVKGQKWGVQNGPPYPLDSSISTGSELKTESLPYAISLNPVYLVYDLFALSYNSIEKAVKNNRAEKFVENYKDIDVNTIKKESDLPKIIGKHSEKEDMSVVNNKGDTRKPERSHNCVLCSIAYDLRRKGYDVVAGDSTYGLTDHDILKIYKGKNSFSYVGQNNPDDEIKYSDVVDYMTKNTSIGDSGLFLCKTSWYSSHCINFDHTENGIEFKDGQCNEVMTKSKMNKTFDFTPDYNCYSPPRYLVTNNLEVNTKKISENKYIKARCST